MRAKDIVDFQFLDDVDGRENATYNNDTRTINRRLNYKVLKISGPALLGVLLVVIISIVLLRGSKSEDRSEIDGKSEKMKGGTAETNRAKAFTSTTTKLAFENVSTTPTNSSSFGTTDFDPFTEVAISTTALPKYPKPSLNITTYDWYIIMSNSDGFVMDVHLSSKWEGTLVNTRPYLHGHNQHFRITNLIKQLNSDGSNNTKLNLMNRNSGLYVGRSLLLGVSDRVVQCDSDTASNALWTLHETAEAGVVQIRDETGIKCLVNENNVTDPDLWGKGNLVMRECRSDNTSEWLVLRFCQDEDSR